ncbi:MAG: hypothetical protein J4478_01140 [Candidatus Diapherotrites archaeon]|uniref:Uncharacterized protein n=1 Tax=Candidatus Iainarchaeum sp. TaxID=3101447 RepID=A0A7J4JWH4_9ARCH|nr:hypothetical protein [Candidatus Diapherotrites archaeon]HIH21834.1 hypothetical protein [Candidatus Diapherotrites archaeon]
MDSMSAKGQAAVTDALFLLLVVGILSASLTVFSIQYGSTIQKYISSQYIIDFETSALKTMLYSTVSRDSGKTVYDAKQVDYLLAVVKEDYLDDADLNSTTKDILRSALKISMKPLSSSFDYLFLIETTDLSRENDFVLIYLYSSPSLPGEAHLEYYCTAKDSLNIQRFLESVGSFVPVASGIKLSKVNERNKNADSVSAIAELALWVGTDLNSIRGKSVVFTENELSTIRFDDASNIGCNADFTGSCAGWLACKRITN